MYKNKRGKDWHTRADNKVKIFDNVRGLLCNDYFDALPQPLWAEMRNCGISDKGIPGHQKGGYDDTTIAFCLAQWYAYEYPTPTITQTKRTMIEKFKSKQRARLLRSNGPIPYRRKEW